MIENPREPLSAQRHSTSIQKYLLLIPFEVLPFKCASVASLSYISNYAVLRIYVPSKYVPLVVLALVRYHRIPMYAIDSTAINRAVGAHASCACQFCRLNREPAVGGSFQLARLGNSSRELNFW